MIIRLLLLQLLQFGSYYGFSIFHPMPFFTREKIIMNILSLSKAAETVALEQPLFVNNRDLLIVTKSNNEIIQQFGAKIASEMSLHANHGFNKADYSPEPSIRIITIESLDEATLRATSALLEKVIAFNI